MWYQESICPLRVKVFQLKVVVWHRTHYFLRFKQINVSYKKKVMHNISHRCGPSQHNNGMLGAWFKFEFPCTTFRASNCYIPRAHWTKSRCWVMLWLHVGIFRFLFHEFKEHSSNSLGTSDPLTSIVSNASMVDDRSILCNYSEWRIWFLQCPTSLSHNRVFESPTA